MPAEFDALVAKLKRDPDVGNPFALARHILGTDKEIRRKRKRRKGNK